jgi:hypothetical protein
MKRAHSKSTLALAVSVFLLAVTSMWPYEKPSVPLSLVDSSLSPTPSTPTDSTLPSTNLVQGDAPKLPSSAETYDQWVQQCGSANLQVPDACLADGASAIAQTDGVPAAMSAFRRALEVPILKIACHTASHKFGMTVYSVTQDIEKALTQVDSTCELGVIHGVFETWGKSVTDEAVTGLALGLCSKVSGKDPSFPARKCAHGVGHAAWPSSGGDLEDALAVCDALGEEQMTIECGGGVTMSMLLGVGSVAPVSIKSVSDVLKMCNSYSMKHRNSCVVEAGPMMLRLARHDVAQAIKYCAQLDPGLEGAKELNAVYHCTSASGYTAPEQSKGDPAEMVRLCSAASTELLVGGCLSGAIRQMRMRDIAGTDEVLEKLCVAAPAFYKQKCTTAITEPVDY